MEPVNWAPEHSAALRDLVGRGMSFSKIAKSINTKFGTSYSRNATLGRARRMGFGGLHRPESPPRARPRLPKLPKLHSAESRSAKIHRPMPTCEQAEPVKLRCADIEPRHLALVELERGDCRYPYGGDAESEPITFCGHPRRPGSSYCTPHFHLSRDPEVVLERPESFFSLQVVEVA
jgi:GcrA cell cycle regulator